MLKRHGIYLRRTLQSLRWVKSPTTSSSWSTLICVPSTTQRCPKLAVRHRRLRASERPGQTGSPCRTSTPQAPCSTSVDGHAAFTVLALQAPAEADAHHATSTQRHSTNLRRRSTHDLTQLEIDPQRALSMTHLRRVMQQVLQQLRARVEEACRL